VLKRANLGLAIANSMTGNKLADPTRSVKRFLYPSPECSQGFTFSLQVWRILRTGQKKEVGRGLVEVEKKSSVVAGRSVEGVASVVCQSKQLNRK
jgi:hypothetical protein